MHQMFHTADTLDTNGVYATTLRDPSVSFLWLLDRFRQNAATYSLKERDLLHLQKDFFSISDIDSNIKRNTDRLKSEYKVMSRNIQNKKTEAGIKIYRKHMWSQRRQEKKMIRIFRTKRDCESDKSTIEELNRILTTAKLNVNYEKARSYAEKGKKNRQRLFETLKMLNNPSVLSKELIQQHIVVAPPESDTGGSPWENTSFLSPVHQVHPSTKIQRCTGEKLYDFSQPATRKVHLAFMLSGDENLNQSGKLLNKRGEENDNGYTSGSSGQKQSLVVNNSGNDDTMNNNNLISTSKTTQVHAESVNKIGSSKEKLISHLLKVRLKQTQSRENERNRVRNHEKTIKVIQKKLDLAERRRQIFCESKASLAHQMILNVEKTHRHARKVQEAEEKRLRQSLISRVALKKTPIHPRWLQSEHVGDSATISNSKRMNISEIKDAGLSDRFLAESTRSNSAKANSVINKNIHSPVHRNNLSDASNKGIANSSNSNVGILVRKNNRSPKAKTVHMTKTQNRIHSDKDSKVVELLSTQHSSKSDTKPSRLFDANWRETRLKRTFRILQTTEKRAFECELGRRHFEDEVSRAAREFVCVRDSIQDHLVKALQTDNFEDICKKMSTPEVVERYSHLKNLRKIRISAAQHGFHPTSNAEVSGQEGHLLPGAGMESALHAHAAEEPPRFSVGAPLCSPHIPATKEMGLKFEVLAKAGQQRKAIERSKTPRSERVLVGLGGARWVLGRSQRQRNLVERKLLPLLPESLRKEDFGSRHRNRKKMNTPLGIGSKEESSKNTGRVSAVKSVNQRRRLRTADGSSNILPPPATVSTLYAHSPSRRKSPAEANKLLEELSNVRFPPDQKFSSFSGASSPTQKRSVNSVHQSIIEDFGEEVMNGRALWPVLPLGKNQKSLSNENLRREIGVKVDKCALCNLPYLSNMLSGSISKAAVDRVREERMKIFKGNRQELSTHINNQHNYDSAIKEVNDEMMHKVSKYDTVRLCIFCSHICFFESVDGAYVETHNVVIESKRSNITGFQK